MPIYNYRCTKCSSEFQKFLPIAERNTAKCPECSSSELKMLFKPYNRGFVLEPQWFEHLDTEPIWIESKQHLKEECKKRGVIAKCLGD